MKIYNNPSKKEWKELCKRPSQDNPVVMERVCEIVEKVIKKGDIALFDLTEKIDGVRIDSLEVSQEEIIEAEKSVTDEIKNAIEIATVNISAFHEAQLPPAIKVETREGVVCYQKPVAIERVGIYIPGGTAPLFSTVLMLALPAKIAGCKEIIMCTPCNKTGKISPVVLYAAHKCGVNSIFKLGGAQAIAAMANGTETIPKVDKIFGPGNSYVTMAKQLVGGRLVSIDMPAGPSEVMVMADSTANPEFIAADLLSQAEHGPDSQVILVCDNNKIACEVKNEIEKQSKSLERTEYIARSLEHSRLIVLSCRDEMISFANEYAAEHLIIQLDNPWEVADRITAAGSIFIGNYSPESAGDYASGTNHTLPTAGWAVSCSGVNIDSYIRKITIQELSKKGLETLSPTIIAMAQAEGLKAHAEAVRLRIESDEEVN